MSKHETHMTEGFWQSQGKGAFLAEYPLVLRAADRSARLADAVILPDEPFVKFSWRDYPKLAGRNVIVVQTKPHRMGMYLMGEALFSARLASAQGAASVRSLLCAIKLMPRCCRFSNLSRRSRFGYLIQAILWLAHNPYKRPCKLFP